MLISNGDFSSAKEYLDRSLTIARANDDEVEIANVISKLGSWEYHQDRFVEAIEQFEMAINILRDADKAFHPDVAKYLNNLGFIHGKLGKPCLASQYIEEALDVLELKIGIEHPDYREIADNLVSLDMEKCSQ
ncbi:MAG: tetratricopeptide repeat protein [Paracoccaceae bacterium]